MRQSQRLRCHHNEQWQGLRRVLRPAFYDCRRVFERIRQLKYDKHDTSTKHFSLVMFNRVARKGIVATRNIRDTMSRSKKKSPASTCCCCKSQKRGKQFCNRKFRRRERMMIGKGQYDRLPNKPIEVTDPWDLGGDGKTFWGFSPDEDWFIRLMRK